MKFRTARVLTVREFYDFEAEDTNEATKIVASLNEGTDDGIDLELVYTRDLDDGDFELIGEA